MKSIVTGSLGFIGSNLVDKLIEEGHEVLGLDNISTGSLHYLNKKAKFLNLDIRDNYLENKTIKDFNPEVIFHLAAQSRVQPSFKTPKFSLETNSQGTVNILELARLIGSRVVYAGSSAFYFDPYANPYVYSKWIGEEHCKLYNKLYNVPVAIARFFNVFGNRMTSHGENAAVLGIFERQKINNEELTVTGTGEKRRDFCHVEDICSGLIAMSKDNWNCEIFNLGSGINYSINEVARMFNPIGIKYLPNCPGEALETLADISFTTEKLGWTPKHNLKDYINEFLNQLN